MQEAFSLNHYKIVRTYSTTSFRSTYLAQLIHEDQKKVLLKAYLFKSPMELDQLLTRAGQLGALSHPSIIPLLDYGVKDDHFYTVRTYFPYGSLRTLLNVLAGQPLALEESLQIVLRIGQALKHAHEQEIYHARLSVTNILIDTDGQALLGDFALLPASSMRFGPDDTDTNQFGYTAPEQFAGACDGRSDQYSLACLAYELLSGKPPFADGELSTIQHAHARVMPPHLSEPRPELPMILVHLIHKALAKNPDDRYPDMASFLDTFEAILRGDDVVVDIPLDQAVVPAGDESLPAGPISEPLLAELSLLEESVSGEEKTDKHVALRSKKSFKKKKKSGKRVVGSSSSRALQADPFQPAYPANHSYGNEPGTQEYSQEGTYGYVEDGKRQEEEYPYPYSEDEDRQAQDGGYSYGYVGDEPGGADENGRYGYTEEGPGWYDVYAYNQDEDAGDAYGYTENSEGQEEYPDNYDGSQNGQEEDGRYGYGYGEQQPERGRENQYNNKHAKHQTKQEAESVHGYAEEIHQGDQYHYEYADEPGQILKQEVAQPVLNQYAPTVGVIVPQQAPLAPNPPIVPPVSPLLAASSTVASLPPMQPHYNQVAPLYDQLRNIRVENARTRGLGMRRWSIVAVAVTVFLMIIMVSIAAFIPLSGRPESASTSTREVVSATPTSSFSYVSSQATLPATATPSAHPTPEAGHTPTPIVIKPTPIPIIRPTTKAATRPMTPPAPIPTPVPTPTPTPPTSYEAEASGNTIAGGAQVLACDGCSGGERVGYLGNGAYLQFNSIVVNASGNYVVIIYYTNGDTGRAVFISSNGGTSKIVVGVQNPGDKDWNTVRQTTATVSLHAGVNTILLANPDYASPDIDRIVVD